MYPTPASALPPTKLSAVTVTVEFAISISTIWSLTGTTSLELGVTINSTTVEVVPLIFDILAMFNELIIIAPVL